MKPLSSFLTKGQSFKLFVGTLRACRKIHFASIKEIPKKEIPLKLFALVLIHLVLILHGLQAFLIFFPQGLQAFLIFFLPHGLHAFLGATNGTYPLIKF